MSMRRQSRVSSHASLPENKSEAAFNERSTRSRTSSEDLVVLELPRIVRTKRSGHQRSGIDGQHDAIKNGKAGSSAVSLEGKASRRGLRSTEYSVAKETDAAANVEHHSGGGGGDANVSGRTRKRSGRITSTAEETEKAQTHLQEAQTDGRSLRRRTRSGTSVDGVGNGPAERTKDNDPDNSQQKSCGEEVSSSHKTSPSKIAEEDANTSDGRKDIDEVTSLNEHHQKSEDLPQSTSVHKISNASKSQQTRPGETVVQAGTITIASIGSQGCSEQPREVRNKMPKLNLPSASSEEPLSRTSPRRARQSHSQSNESKNSLMNDKQEVSEPDPATEGQCLASNGIRGGKTTPRKRTRSSSTSISPRKPPESQDVGPPEPGSPKRRRTGTVCRDLSQDFDTATLASTDITPSSYSQSECNNEIMADPQDASASIDRTLEATLNDGDGKETSKSITLTPDSFDTRTTANTVGTEVSLPQRSRHRSGTSPRGSPLKQAQLDLTKSPTRRGLRSGGAIPETPPEEIQGSGVTDNNTDNNRVETTPSVSPTISPRKSSGKKKGSGKKDGVLPKEEGRELVGESREQTQEAGLSREDVDCQAEEWYEDVDETEPFYFESDHMAIKGNKDYRMLLRTLTTLEAQRKQAIQDLDRLLECRDKALKNPIKFVHKLQHKEMLSLPHSQRVVTCPDIDWGRYIGPPETNELLGLVSQPRSMRPSKSASNLAHSQVGCGSCGLSQIKPVPTTSTASQALPSGAGVPASLEPNKPSTSSISDEAQSTDVSEMKPEQKVEIVRGRVAEGNKPPTFNQLWTRDEQRRLEEFLVKYPTEDVEARRWEKIAKALGNRTAQQVASRVQKYFIKLMKAGMPVPGRLPSVSTYQNCRKGKKIHPFTKPLFQPSTFLQSIQPPVYMSEDDPYSYTLDDDDDELVSDDESIPVDVRDTSEYQELIQLKLMKRKKVRQQGHAGYRCDGCDMEPILGVRWHCIECPEPISTDLCQNCVNCNFSSKHHSSSHRMEPVHTGYSQSYVDGDYTSFEPSSGDYNYLDPNYNPMQATT
ncbi:ZZ-type zinc finger-containing protein 3-like [Acanthaster planci]|uniref:ZZ-type zinc finger-containing protein 3-like n=1 Tax=Acanthaster planci TaxID=133434 RepID=A0A8B7YMQ7_ACAPL|nr:ZZ-type zinc finger-containing protein 3-like [Acanthaster planci]XP_022093944.1 ZZ-type zinc finger-containing protein 3-like [Acanthaster planci]